MTPAVRIRDLAVGFGDRTVLDRIDLDVAPGEWLSVIGPNGAGKTTLLRAVLDAVDHEGSVEIDGIDGGGGLDRARAIALVPQTPVIPPGVRVVDYVLLGRTPHRGVFAGESRHDLDVVADVLDRLDLSSFADREVRSLSGGERQRVVLGRALAQEARLLLLDEPTTALDLGRQQDVLDLVDHQRAERGLTVLATLHDLTLAGRYGDRVALLAGGRIVAEGAPAAVLTESTIATHFGARVRVIGDPAGPVIAPA